jgi:hypothetical protein
MDRSGNAPNLCFWFLQPNNLLQLSFPPSRTSTTAATWAVSCYNSHHTSTVVLFRSKLIDSTLSRFTCI